MKLSVVENDDSDRDCCATIVGLRVALDCTEPAIFACAHVRLQVVFGSCAKACYYCFQAVLKLLAGSVAARKYCLGTHIGHLRKRIKLRKQISNNNILLIIKAPRAAYLSGGRTTEQARASHIDFRVDEQFVTFQGCRVPRLYKCLPTILVRQSGATFRRQILSSRALKKPKGPNVSHYVSSELSIRSSASSSPWSRTSSLTR